MQSSSGKPERLGHSRDMAAHIVTQAVLRHPSRHKSLPQNSGFEKRLDNQEYLNELFHSRELRQASCTLTSAYFMTQQTVASNICCSKERITDAIKAHEQNQTDAAQKEWHKGQQEYSVQDISDVRGC